jgi:hypothetical protein
MPTTNPVVDARLSKIIQQATIDAERTEAERVAMLAELAAHRQKSGG